MTTTIEEKLETLSQSIDAIAGELNSRRGETSGKAGMKSNTDTNLGPVFAPRVTLTTALADYDFANIESARGGKVVRIVETLNSSGLRPDGSVMALLKVELANGKKTMVKAPFIAGQKSNPTGAATTPARPNVARTDSNADADLLVISSAAVNLERLSAHTPALQSFYTFTHSKGAAYCYGVLRPLLTREPFPAGASTGQRIAHMRGLLTKRVAPEVAKLAPSQQAEEQIQQQVESLLPGSLEAYRADTSLRAEFPSFDNYRAFVSATGGAVVAHRIRLEKQAKQPRMVGGEWTLGKIGEHEQSWLNDPKLQSEFPTPEGYAAYRRRMG
jgi:hypothetical protein